VQDYELAQTGIVLTLLGFCVSGAGSPLSTTDLWAWRAATDPQISPDGRAVVFVQEWNDHSLDAAYSNLWIVRAKEKTFTRLRKARGGHVTPVVARRNADRLLSDRSGAFQIYIRTIESGQETQIARLEQPPQALAWSSDGAAMRSPPPYP